MINAGQFRQYVIREPLEAVNLWSPEAEKLLLGTAAQESRLGAYLRQVGKGPALGVFQMEPATHNDIWDNFLAYREQMISRLRKYISGIPEDMVVDMRHACIMARLQYYRRPEPLPEVDDLEGQALYWKLHYNTIHGAGTQAEYISNYIELVANG